MKNLQLFTGGHPLTLDDFQHSQEGNMESLAAIVRGLMPEANDACILRGCRDSGGGTFAGGLVYYQGEIYQVDTQAVVLLPHFVLEATVRNNETVTYLDTQQRAVHQIRKLRLQAGAGLVAVGDVPRLEDLLRARISLSTILGDYATVAQLNTLEASLLAYIASLQIRPEFRVNGGVLQWRRTDLNGGNPSPWVDLLIGVVNYFFGTNGLFEARINTNKQLPAAYRVVEVVDFDAEVVDDGNNFVLLRKYVAPVSGEYEFVFDQASVRVVQQNPSFNSLSPAAYYQVRFRVNSAEIDNVLILNGGSPFSQTELQIGLELPANDSIILLAPIQIRLQLNQGDEVTLVHEFIINPVDQFSGANYASYARESYRLASGRLYTL